MRRDSQAQNAATLIERCSSPRDSANVLPSSLVRICANSSLCSSNRRAARATIFPREGAGIERQTGKAAAADSTALLASSRVACFTVPITSSVLAGLILLTVFEDADSTHWPLLKFR